MLKMTYLKYWLLITIVSGYYFMDTLLPGVIPYDMPRHLEIISRVIMIAFCVFSAGLCISYMADDMWKCTDSIQSFGNRRLWWIWNNVYLVPFLYGVYKWENFGVIIVSFVLYLGISAVRKNHNKHVKTYRQHEVLRKARQEQAEEVKL
jgi:hypothetical protein